MSDRFYRAQANHASATAPDNRPPLTKHQEAMLAGVRAAFRQGASIVALDGQAGTGKTTTLGELARDDREVMLTAATNRAAAVLSLKVDMPVVTMHSACMRPLFRPPAEMLVDWIDDLLLSGEYESWPQDAGFEKCWSRKNLELAGRIAASGNRNGAFSVLRFRMMDWLSHWVPKPKQDGLLVVDEASMIGAEALDMATEVYDRVLLVGDTRQLPPVNDVPVFWKAEPRFTLREIHRQRAGCDVIGIAQTALARGVIPARRVKVEAQELYRTGAPVICYFNKTRLRVTRDIRTALGWRPDIPSHGERLIVRNPSPDDKQRGLYNNAFVTVVDFEDKDGETHCVLATDQGMEVTRLVSMERDSNDNYPGPGLKCRSAVAMTCHNAQGGEWPTVLIHATDAWVIGKDPEKFDTPRWMYTAVTRAKEEVFLFTGLAD